MGSVSMLFAVVARRTVTAGLLCFLLVCAVAASVASAEEPVLLSGFGPDGTNTSDFQHAGEVAVDQGTGSVYVLEHEKGSLYRFGANGEPEDFAGTASDISGNEITGLALAWQPEKGFFVQGSLTGTVQVAVNSQSHVFYVTSDSGRTLRAFQADGEPADFTAGPDVGTSEITGFTRLAGVAVDADGDIYASEYGPDDGSGGAIHVYAPSGAPITQFATSRPANIAVAPDGSLYLLRLLELPPQIPGVPELVKLHPSVFPVSGGTGYSVESELSAPAVPNSLAVDSASEDLYLVGGEDVAAGTPARIVEYDSSGNPIGSFAGPEEEGELPHSEGVAVNSATEKVYVSYFARGSQVEVFGPPPPAPPVIVSMGAKGVTSGSGDAVAAIKANSLETMYRFEYGTEACSATPDPCTVISPASGDVGSGRKLVGVSRHLSGLVASTTYHFRVVAENSLGSVVAERVFRTQSLGGPFELVDGRGWELVSPALKPGGGAITAQYGVSAASSSGDAFTFQSSGPIEGDPGGSRAPEPAQSLARRGVSGWSSVQVDAPRERATPVGTSGGDFHFFSGDLARAVVEPKGAPLLSVEASEPTPYLREDFAEPVRWRPLVTAKEGYANVPSGTVFGGEPLVSTNLPLQAVGASSDLRDVVVSSDVPLITGIPSELAGKGLLYEWSDGELAPVSVLPSGQFSAASLGSSAASFGTITGAVSEDGRYVYWSSASHDALYVRDMVNGETVRLDTVRTGASGEGVAAPVFQGASADGTRAFFTDKQRLTTDAGAGFDLYECDLVRPNKDKCVLRDITPKVGEEAAVVQGLVPAIDRAGDTVYFVANGVLSTTPNPNGETAIPGSCLTIPSHTKPGASCNLYVSRLEGEAWQTTFVARLGNQDTPDWALPQSATSPGVFEAPSDGLVAAGSPNGRYLVFMSSRGLTGYDNADSEGGGADEEVYVYDSVTGVLHCASCNPTGGEPNGVLLGEALTVDWDHIWHGARVAATLPDPITVGANLHSVYRPRAVLDAGRVFFDSVEALVPADSNGTWDAYEYEPIGEGSCTTGSEGPTVARSEGGCVALLSPGTSSGETGVLDSSTSGDDVFFLTKGQLSPRDTDSAYDVYDARVGATPERIVSASECQGEACQPPPVVPSDLTPASSSFEGAGNLLGATSVISGSVVKPRAIGDSEKLTSALRTCRKRYKHSNKKRVVCERQARKRYGAKAKRASRSGKGGR